MGYETDTKKIKVGDGNTAWSSLVYSSVGNFGVGSFTQAVGNGSATTITVTHNLNTRNVVVSVKEASTYAEVLCDVSATSVNAVTLTFATAPTSGQYIVTVIGDNVPVALVNASPFLDNGFTLRNATDTTKQAQFSAQDIPTGTTRTYNLPPQSGTLASQNDTLRVFTATTIGTIGIGSIELGHATDTTLSRSSAGVLAVEGAVIPSVSSTNTLTNKTISGASNTITNIPASATPNASRLVATTAIGGTGTEDGANTWAKIATLSFGTTSLETQCLLAITGGNSGNNFDTAIISVFGRSRPTPNVPWAYVEMLSKGGSTSAAAHIGSDSFKIISGGFGTDIELWMQKKLINGVFTIFEISRSTLTNSNAIIYHDGAAWQSATPTGAVNNISTNGVTAFGVPVVTSGGAGQVADVSVVGFGASTARAVGTGDFPFGVKLQRAITFTSVTFRAATADASGNLVVELRKNGTQVAGTPTTIAAASQVAGGTSTGTWAFAAGDILTVQVTAVGTTPGKGLIADIKGLTT
jgi:hypothetical protein